jgi:alpha-1,3-rhamnosyl/mannosyltransferase
LIKVGFREWSIRRIIGPVFEERIPMTVRVAFHQSPALRARTGVGHYVAQLLDELRHDPKLDVAGLPDGWLARLYGSTSNVVGPTASAKRGLRHQALRVGERLFLRHLAGRLTSRRFDLYHEPNLPVLATELPTVVTLYDLSPLRFPEYQPLERVHKFEEALPSALSQARHIITISDFIREEIIRILGVPAERVTRTYLGVRDTMARLADDVVTARLDRLGLPRSYLLHVGTLEPRKNLLVLMQAYCRLPANLRERCPLLLVGGWGWNTESIAAYFDTEARHRGVRHLGYLPETDLAVLYNGARALVFPTHYEGFGLPPLEMMACGGAVLASTAGALVEILGDAAHLTPAEDRDGWTNALARIIEDDDWRRELSRRGGERAARYTWRKCAQETAAVYRRVLGRSAGAVAAEAA